MAQFDAREYKRENPDDRTFPVGWYRVKCESSEMKSSSNGHDMVTLKIRINDSISGHFINAIQWENLTIGHPSAQTSKFARDKLAEIMLACGVDVVNTWGDIAEHGSEFAMSIGKSQTTGRMYAIYRPLSAYLAAASKAAPKVQQPAIPAYQELTPPPMHDPYIDDIPF